MHIAAVKGVTMLKTSIRTAVLVLGLTLGAASAARADGYISPFVGANFGGSADDGSLSEAAGDVKKFTYGFNLGWMGAGVFGVDLDFAYTRDFFGDDDSVDGNSVLTLIPNLILGVPFGGQTGGGFRPYGTAGIGMITRNLELDGDDVFEGSDWAFSFGAGAMIFFSDSVGIKGDYKYIRAFDLDDIGDVLTRGDEFWFNRANIGVVFRF
jgi:opacity protein-like surface antigen